MQALLACVAPEIAVVGRLDARLPELVVQVVRRPELLQLVLSDCTHIAEHLRGEGLIRVVADVGTPDRQARELLGVLVEVRDHRVARRLTHDERRQQVAVPRLDRARDLVQRNARGVRDALQLVVAVVVILRQIGGPELDGARRDVRDERLAVPVDDRPARRG